MGLKYLFLILLWSLSVNAQGPRVKIHGTVKCSQPNVDMTFFRIRSFVATETLTKTVSCDRSGYYEVFWDLDSAMNRQVIVFAYQGTLAYNHAYPRKEQECKLRWHSEPRFYQGSSSYFFVSDAQPKRFDFMLDKPGSVTWAFLPVRFKKDKLDLEVDSLNNNTYTMHNSLCIVSSYLQDYPDKKVEIHGNAWQERNPQELSMARAELVARQLETYNVARNRIKIVADGDSVSNRMNREYLQSDSVHRVKVERKRTNWNGQEEIYYDYTEIEINKLKSYPHLRVVYFKMSE